jgi:hypothetical protein
LPTRKRSVENFFICNLICNLKNSIFDT